MFKKLKLLIALVLGLCWSGTSVVLAQTQKGADEYIYFDLAAGNVVFSGGNYTGSVYVNGNSKSVTGTHKAANKYYIYQSSTKTGNNDKSQTGYATTADFNAHRNCRLPNYPAVTYGGQAWSNYITNNSDVDAVQTNWGNAISGTDRTSSSKRISFRYNGTYNVVLDNIYTTFETNEAQRKNGGITIGNKEDESNTALPNCKVTLRLKGDSRVSSIYYYSGQETDEGELHLTSFEGDGSNSGSITVVSYVKNFDKNNCCCIGCAGNGSGTQTGMNKSYRTYFDGGTVYAGMPKHNGTGVWESSGLVTHVIGSRQVTGVIVNGGRLTAVSNSTAAAIGGGGGYVAAGGQATVEIKGGYVYAYNHSIYAKEYKLFVPCVAIGGSSSVEEPATLTTINITGGHVFAQSKGGCAIGGGGSAKKAGGPANINISGSAYVEAKSLAGSISGHSFPAGSSIGGGTGGKNANTNGGYAVFHIDGGTLRAGSIGGGSTLSSTGKVGYVKAYITDGDVQAQFMMAEGSTDHCVFEMRGGKLHGSDYTSTDYPLVKSDGGAVWMDDTSGTATISGGEIYGNNANRGGAIYMTGGQLNVTGGKIYGNTATTNGGSAYLGGGNFTMSAGEVSGNTATQNGGGFYVNGGSVTITDGDIKNNIATTGNGGGFYSAGGTVNISGAEISNNHAYDGDGGAFYSSSGTTTISGGAAVESNTAKNGGGVYVNGTLTITDTEISGNLAAFDGGGVYSNSGTLTINTGVEASDNHAQRDGGGFFVNDGGAITMAGGSISENNADRSGGGIYTKGNFDLGDGINDCTLNGNTAGHNGGAVYVEDGEIVIKNAWVFENTANGDGSEGGGKGGGIYCGGTLTLNSGTIEKNGAREGGGIFMDTEATMTFYDGIVKENTAVNGGGVYNSREATLNLIKSAQIIDNKCYNNYDGGMGGGIYQNGFLNVAGTQLKVQNNQSVSLSSSTPVANNVFLPEDGNFITVVDWEDPDTHATIQGLSGSEVWIGISVPTVPHAVVHSETPDDPGHIIDFYDEVGQAFRIFLKDDINRYSAVYADAPYPYNHKDIFFTGTWQIGALDLITEGERKFEDGDLGDQAAVDAYFGNIDSEGKLARFMCYINGLDGYSPHPAQSGKVTADLYMEQYIWLPIGADDGTNTHPEGVEVEPYTGTFDGNGHIISGLKTIALAGLKYYGLFGRTNNATVKNTFAIDCDYYSNSEDDRIGCIIGEMIGGKMYYSEGEGKLSAEGIRAIMGGLVGYAEDAEIHSCMAMPAMECNGANAIMGGLVGKMYATSSKYCRLYNCFANPQFRTTSSTAFGGGLVGYMDKFNNDFTHVNTSECYVRLDRKHIIPETNKIGQLVGKMEGGKNVPIQMTNVYMPTEDYCGAPGYSKIMNLVGEVTSNTAIVNMAYYEPVSDPGTYYYDPDQDTKIVDIPSGHSVPDPDHLTLMPQLQKQAINRNWVEDPASRPNPPLCYWKRTGASSFMASGGTINGDYPILDFDSVSPICGKDFAPAYIALGSRDGIAIDYCPTFSDMLQRYNKYEGGGTINLFHSADNTNGTVRHTDDDVRLYIDEGINILQGPGSHINAVSYQTLQHSTDYWHTFSTVMGPKADASGVVQGMSKIGIKYRKVYPVPHNFDNNPCEVFLDQGGNDSEPNSNSTLFPYDTPVENFDFYSFYEPEYHWINFKRNSKSHWHMDNYDQNIQYENEEYLMPGKGYLIALSPEKKIYEYGTLNCGNITTSTRPEDLITYTERTLYGPSYSGYNLMGNPYQAYLDFDKFAATNSGLWGGTSNLDQSYYIYDSDIDAYVGYKSGVEPALGSCMPSKWLAPHQGFFIVKSNTAEDAPTTARFIETGTDGMCSLTGDGDGSLLRDGKPSYKLVNLRVADESGHADVASVEFGRPSLGGAAKQKSLRTGKGIIYTRHEGEDYAMLFLDEDVESLPLHFDCTESGTYTLSWNTANGEFVRLTLVDNLAGVSTDCLSHDSYVFEASPDDYSSRFKLVFRYAFDEEEGEGSDNGTCNFVFASNGDLIVNGSGELSIMDVNGHVLYSTRLTDTQSRVSVPQVAAGIYLVRLNEKVQKIVIE